MTGKRKQHKYVLSEIPPTLLKSIVAVASLVFIVSFIPVTFVLVSNSALDWFGGRIVEGIIACTLAWWSILIVWRNK